MDELEDPGKHQNIASSEESDNYQNVYVDNIVNKCEEILLIDELNEEDYLSRCPELCLLEICKHISRLDLFHMMLVCKKFRPLYYDPYLDSNKWENCQMVIFSTKLGYSFEVVNNNDSFPGRNGNVQARYEYDVAKKLGEKVFTETRSMNARIDYFEQKRMRQLKKTYAGSVPDEFFKAVVDILRHHAITVLFIDKIPFSIFGRLEKLFRGHRIEKLVFQRFQCPTMGDDSDANGFNQFAKNIQRIEIQQTPEMYSIIKEKFFQEIGNSDIRERRLTIEPRNLQIARAHRFFPGNWIIDILLYFHTIALPSMVLDVYLVIPLIMARLDNPDLDKSGRYDESAEWTFSVDRPLDSDIISQTLRHSDYVCDEYSNEYVINTKDVTKDRQARIRWDHLEDGKWGFFPFLLQSATDSEEDSDYDHEEFVRTPKKFLIIGSDGLCIEDHLSHCPDLCLLKIFQHLTRRDLFNVTSANKRLLPLYYDPALNHRKWGNGHLSIYPTLSGYFFDLVVGIDGYPWSEEKFDSYAWFEYEIQKSEDGSFMEKRTLNARRNYVLEFPPDHLHEWPIPDEFFTALSEILRHHEATKIRIENVPLAIFSKMEKILAGHNTHSLSCARMQYESITDHVASIKKSFTTLVKRVRSIDLKDAPELFPLIDEKFIRSIAQSEIYDRQLLISPYAELAYLHRFIPTESILHQIIRFQWLELLSMELDVDWIAPLIMARMEASIKAGFEQRCTWKLALDRPLTSDIISQTIRHADYKYTELDDILFVSTKDQNRHAKIYSEQYLVADGTAIMNVVQICMLNACSF